MGERAPWDPPEETKRERAPWDPPEEVKTEAAKPPVSAGEHLAAAITDIPGEIYDAAKAGMRSLGASFNPWSEQFQERRRAEQEANKQGFLPGLKETVKSNLGMGSSLAAIPEILGAPITGTGRSVIGHGLSALPGNETYEQNREKADLALMGLAARRGPTMPAGQPRVPPPQPPTVADPFGVTLTEGERTGNLNLRAREVAAQRAGAPQAELEHGRAFAEQRRQQLGQAQEDVSRALDPNLQQRVDNPREAAEIAQRTLQQRHATARAGVNTAYEAARAHPGAFDATTFDEFGPRIQQRLTFGDEPVFIDNNTPYAARMIQDIDNNVLNTRQQLTGVNLDEVDRWRRRLSSMRRDAFNSGNGGDARAAQRVIEEFDNHIDQAVRGGQFSGSPEALRAWEAARAAHSEYRSTFRSQGQRDLVGKEIERIIGVRGSAPLTPNDVADVLWSAGGTNPSTKHVQLAMRLRDILGETTPEWSVVRQGLFNRIVESGIPEKPFTPERIADRLHKFLNTDGREMADVMYPAERGMLQQYIAMNRKIAVPQNLPNWSNTAPPVRRAIEAVAQSISNAMGAAIGAWVGHKVPLPMSGEIGAFIGAKSTAWLGRMRANREARELQAAMPLLAQQVRQYQKALARASRINSPPNIAAATIAGTNLARSLKNIPFGNYYIPFTYEDYPYLYQHPARQARAHGGPAWWQHAKARRAGGEVEEEDELTAPITARDAMHSGLFPRTPDVVPAHDGEPARITVRPPLERVQRQLPPEQEFMRGAVGDMPPLQDVPLAVARTLAPEITRAVRGEPGPPIPNVPEYGKVPSTSEYDPGQIGVEATSFMSPPGMGVLGKGILAAVPMAARLTKGATRAAEEVIPKLEGAAALGPRGGGSGAPGLEEAQRRYEAARGLREPLEGLPQKPLTLAGEPYIPGPVGFLHDVAEGYSKSSGIPYRRPKTYQPVDEDRATSIARAFDRMEHNPDDPIVRASYDALINETVAQYKALENAGVKFEFIKPGQADPYYESPRLAQKDFAENKHLWVYPTSSGFGTGPEAEAAMVNNPMLRPTDITIDGKRLLANDVFRIVHDVFGHFKEGVGFRAAGEENAWRSHSAMYSDLAKPAMTSETRGQNSWVNYGPHGEANRTAKADQTVFADQKIGLLPDWMVREGAADPPEKFQQLSSRVTGLKGIAPHLTPEELEHVSNRNAEKLVDLFSSFPAAEEMAAVAYSGRAKRGWYKDSAQALVDVFGAADAPRFAALLAALSPQTGVEDNAINALKVWTGWDKAGRPTNAKDIVKIMGENVQGKLGVGSVLEAWRGNAIRALQSAEPEKLQLSGPKVNSFMLNLRNHVNEVTNDTWMANYANVDQDLFKGRRVKDPASSKDLSTEGKIGLKSPGYMAMSAKVRQAAKIISEKTGEAWTPAEVQETIWSWAKTLLEKAKSGGMDETTEKLLKAGGLTHEDISDTPDFAVLFINGAYRRVLEEAGYGKGLGRAEARIEERGAKFPGAAYSSPTEAEGSGFTQSAFEKHLTRAARRLEDRRYNLEKEGRAAGGRVNGPEVVRTYDVPYLAGASNDGKRMYIDRRLPSKLKVGNKVIDPAKYLLVHEMTERKAMKRGMPYLRAHHDIATPAERAAVEADGVDWKQYERVLDGYIDETEHEKPKRPPPDLYEKPYPCRLRKKLKRLAKKEAA